MCLIITKEINGRVDWKAADSSALSNPDGYGLCWPTKGGKVATLKNLAWKPIRAKAQELEKQNLPFILHQRFATHGKVSKMNCHPFALKSHGLQMAHNGVISTLSVPANKCDSKVLAEELEAIMPRGFLCDNQSIAAVEKLAGSSRLCFMDGNGSIFFVNEDLGEWKDGAWYSQPYAIKAVSRYGYGLGSSSLGGWHNPQTWDDAEAKADAEAEAAANAYAERRAKKLTANKKGGIKTAAEIVGKWKPTQIHPNAPRTKPTAPKVKKKKGGKK